MNNLIKQKLTQLEQTSEKYWNISPESGNLLNLIIRISGYRNILEVGTSNGYSTIWLAEAIKTTSGHIKTIEYYEERINMAISNFKDSGVDDVITILKGKAMDVIQTLDESFDLIFIDANKAEYIEYFKNLHPKLNKNGVFAADNVTSHKSEMKNFLDLILNHPEYRTSYFPFGGGLLIGVKI